MQLPTVVSWDPDCLDDLTVWFDSGAATHVELDQAGEWLALCEAGLPVDEPADWPPYDRYKRRRGHWVHVYSLTAHAVTLVFAIDPVLRGGRVLFLGPEASLIQKTLLKGRVSVW